MTVMYKPKETATEFYDDSLTEQEHLKSCDINHMIASVHRGQDVRVVQSINYGIDDLTMSPIDFRNQKENHERELSRIASMHEFTQEELDSFPPEVRKKFDFKLKKPQPDPITPKNDELNDEKMAKKDQPPKDQTSASPIPPKP